MGRRIADFIDTDTAKALLRECCSSLVESGSIPLNSPGEIMQLDVHVYQKGATGLIISLDPLQESIRESTMYVMLRVELEYLSIKETTRDTLWAASCLGLPKVRTQFIIPEKPFESSETNWDTTLSTS